MTQSVSLGNIGRVITGKTPPKANPEYWGKELDFITPTDFKDSKYIEPVRKLSNEGKRAMQRIICPANSVIVTCIGSDMGKVALAKRPFVSNQQINTIIINTKEADPNFIYYLLKFNRPLLRKYAESGGSTMPIINKTTFEKLSFNIPSVEMQKKVADILGAIDEKIELNRKMNETLEQIGQALFRHYFINNPEVERWEKVKIGEFVDIKGGGTPSTINPDFWNGDIAWTSPRDLTGKNDAYILDTHKRITKQGLSKISSGLLPKGTLLLSSRAPIGYVAIAGLPLAINQGYIAFLPDAYLSNYFMYFWVKQNMDRIKNAANGSTFMEISKSSFRNITTTRPSENILQKFEYEVTNLFEAMQNNQEQTQTLTTLRDTLLPCLMRGEIEIK